MLGFKYKKSVEASKFVKKQVYSGIFEKQGSKCSIIPSELFIVEQHANNGQTIESRKQTLYPVNGSVFVEGWHISPSLQERLYD